MIVFNTPTVTGFEDEHVLTAIKNKKLSGNGPYTHLCQAWMEEHLRCIKALLTPSCTAALELAALLINIQPGDEVIMPSYTFVSTANAFVLRGATIVFVDIHPHTMNMDATQIEAAITPRTKAIVPVHYAGMACDMDAILAIAQQHKLYVIEDAAQALMSTYKGRALGTLGHLGCLSFHETKNYTAAGEGGALLINDEQFVQRAEIMREKGTDRSQFLRGQIDKYTWRDIGSSLLPSEVQAAYLYAQLLQAESINHARLALWNRYHSALRNLGLQQSQAPKHGTHNAHLYYLKLKSPTQRTEFIQHMQANQIQTPFHYIPLHTSPAGMQFGRFMGTDVATSYESSVLVRLPLWHGLDTGAQDQVIAQVFAFEQRMIFS